MYDVYLFKFIVLYVDYKIDVNFVCNKFVELLCVVDVYDEILFFKVQVVDSFKELIVIWVLCSVRNVLIVWDLYCQLWEDMVVYIVRLEVGKYLVKEWVKLQY